MIKVGELLKLLGPSIDFTIIHKYTIFGDPDDIVHFRDYYTLQDTPDCVLNEAVQSFSVETNQNHPDYVTICTMVTGGLKL